MGRLPESYLLSSELYLSGVPRVPSGFAGIRMGVFKGKEVAVNTLSVSGADDKTKTRKIREVGTQATPSCVAPLTYRTALL